jgi:hypothetical protein
VERRSLWANALMRCAPACAAATACAKPKMRVMLHLMPSFSSTSHTRMPSHVPASCKMQCARPAVSQLRSSLSECVSSTVKSMPVLVICNVSTRTKKL